MSSIAKKETFHVFWFDRSYSRSVPPGGIEVPSAKDAILCVQSLPSPMAGGLAISVSTHGEDRHTVKSTFVLAQSGEVDPAIVAQILA